MRTQVHGNRPALFEGRASRVYDFMARRLLRGLYRRIADDLVDAVREGADVLDVGTGPGVLLVEVARLRQDLRLSGVDISADMVAAATRNLAEFGERASARHGDVTDLPFPDGSFDVAVSSLSLHHWDRTEAAGPELARVLRPGGRAYIYDFPGAPFDELAAGIPGGARGRQTPLRIRIPLFPRLVRFVVPVEAS
jgi:ubiquinone/menaquinone biosynthesis C-methylase UbiE